MEKKIIKSTGISIDCTHSCQYYKEGRKDTKAYCKEDIKVLKRGRSNSEGINTDIPSYKEIEDLKQRYNETYVEEIVHKLKKKLNFKNIQTNAIIQNARDILAYPKFIQQKV